MKDGQNMAQRVITPAGSGFLMLNAHPAGCEQSVNELAAAVPGLRARTRERPPVALIIGCSAGYGLAATIAGLTRHGISGLGICLEKAPGRRTGTPGWYRTAATAAVAASCGSSFSFLNADAFADSAKDEAAAILSGRYGPLDYLIYSVAAFRRTDPDTGITYSSVVKPLGQPAVTRTLSFTADGGPVLGETAMEPASEREKAATIAVMGGADWQRWIAALAAKGLLGEGFRTVAMTSTCEGLAPVVYRSATIGAAKEDLEAAAGRITEALDGTGGRAWTCGISTAVTQASNFVPGMPLYLSLLRAVMGSALQTPSEQAVQLWDQLTGNAPMILDEAGRIRLDHLEQDPGVQAEVTRRWHDATQETIGELADTTWFWSQFRRLYGFGLPGIDYAAEVETDVPWPDPEQLT
jgi:enoyl-[acyl-carrier protein] reductase/trans-2-enoyl-CoA reductase (NAD+)